MKNKLIPGLVSVTFRQLSPEDIIDITYASGLKAVEWGSDVHLPAGNADTAEFIRKRSDDTGIMPISYGSYYGKGESGYDMFSKLVNTAKAIGTDNIRIWAGGKDSGDVSLQERAQYVLEAQKLADIAKENGIDVSFECHKSTLTDTPDSALKLIEEIGRDNVYLYWQPLQSEDIQLNKNIIKRFLPYLKNVHVYAWKGLERFALAEHEKAWREYIDVLRQSEQTRALLLEFVKNDSVEQFKADADTLLGWLDK